MPPVAPEVVFHLAARSLVRPAFADPIGTYEVNVLGTANVLEAVRDCPSVRAVVVVTSDKVYEPHADGAPHTEDAPLGGVDPYSSSKAGAELVTAAYRRSYLADGGGRRRDGARGQRDRRRRLGGRSCRPGPAASA